MSGYPQKTARELAELALQRISAFTVNDSAADSVETERALEWMGLVLAEKAGTFRVWGFVPSPIEFDCPEVTAPPYDLLSIMGAAAPENGFMYALAARRVLADGKPVPIRLSPRWEFMNQRGRPNAGTPCQIYIDHSSARPLLWIDPVPAADADIRLSLDVVVPPEDPTSPGPKKILGNVKLDVREEFYMWLVLQTAFHLGCGPVRNLPLDERKQLFDEADTKWKRLDAWRNEDVSDRPRRTARGCP